MPAPAVTGSETTVSVRRSLAIALFVCLGFSCIAGPTNAPFRGARLRPTVKGGHEWFANWAEPRTIPAYATDPKDACFNNEEGSMVISNGMASLPPGMTRLVVLASTNTGPGALLWTNVEMTIYVRRGKASRELDYQAFYLSARSGLHHNDSEPCEGTSYHATARFDGRIGFKKEIWHPGGYTKLRPYPDRKWWKTVPEGQWLGFKLLCQNCDGGQHVRLRFYLDKEAKNEWFLITETVDSGDWDAEKAGCGKPLNYVITEGRPAVYFRTDYVAVEVKDFSVREIEALP